MEWWSWFTWVKQVGKLPPRGFLGSVAALGAGRSSDSGGDGFRCGSYLLLRFLVGGADGNDCGGFAAQGA